MQEIVLLHGRSSVVPLEEGRLKIAYNQFDLSAQKLSAGQHTFRFSATCDGYEKMSQDIVVTVQKANISAKNKRIPTVTAPMVNTLTYNDTEQALVTAGKTSAGTMPCWLDDFQWSEQIPTAKNAGEYTVWYKVQGNAEYADAAEQSVAVTAAETLSGTGTLSYAQMPDMSKTGTTAINITGTLSNGNYEITYAPGTLTVSNRPSSGGGGSASGGRPTAAPAILAIPVEPIAR